MNEFTVDLALGNINDSLFLCDVIGSCKAHLQYIA